MYRTRREPAATPPTAAGKHLCVSSADRHRLQLCHQHGAKRRGEIDADNLTIALMRACTDLRPDVLQPSVEKLCDSEPVRLDGCAGLHLGNEARALDLSLPLRSRKRTPAALALASFPRCSPAQPSSRTGSLSHNF